jgi:3-methyladenine DNA glycosylase AlkD
MITDRVLTELDKHASHADAAFLSRFFKTGAGEYGAGDVFIGVRVPQVRQVAGQFTDISLAEIEALLDSPIHEVRLCAAVIMLNQTKHADDTQYAALYNLYLRRSDRINNWDIVDISCRGVVGGYLLRHPEHINVLTKLAKSPLIWDRRIAMVSTWQFIREGQLDQTFLIAGLLLHDKHDLMHKAVGWMLRSAGDKDPERLRTFLTEHIQSIPRTALRYAIEHFDTEERQYFLRLS